MIKPLAVINMVTTRGQSGSSKKQSRPKEAKKDVKPKTKAVPKTKKSQNTSAKAPPPKKTQKGSSYKGYTSDEYKKLLKLRPELDQLAATKLKEECRLNDQKVTGTKKELIERVADGRIKGAIPKCENCGGGRPRFDPKTGNYKCPGYMEDDDFVNCNKVYKSLERTKWQLTV